MSSPHRVGCLSTRLNESPSEKEGKSALAREGMLGESDPQ